MAEGPDQPSAGLYLSRLSPKQQGRLHQLESEVVVMEHTDVALGEMRQILINSGATTATHSDGCAGCGGNPLQHWPGWVLTWVRWGIMNNHIKAAQ